MVDPFYERDYHKLPFYFLKSYYDNICRDIGPRVLYLFVYWACGPSQELGVVRGGKIFDRRDYVSK